MTTYTAAPSETPSKAENLARAKTIIEQLGGMKFVSMTGAKNLVAGDNSLTFRLPSGMAKDNINCVTVKLTGTDLYDVTFHHVRGTKVSVVSERRGIANTDLVSVFVESTGLRTSL